MVEELQASPAVFYHTDASYNKGRIPPTFIGVELAHRQSSASSNISDRNIQCIGVADAVAYIKFAAQRKDWRPLLESSESVVSAQGKDSSQ
jgi:hypothetical protein